MLAEALELWRGPPFSGVRSEWLARSEAPRLTERYLSAVERYAELEIAAGRSPDLGRLRELAAQYPLHEPLWARLLIALGQQGRTAEALERYAAFRARLVEDLGVDPSTRLREIHEQLRARAASASNRQQFVPRQLPVDAIGFVGRDVALTTLDGLLDKGDRVATITGTAGVGKTAVAVHWAHRVPDRFPDGQLYLNLRGFDPSTQAMTPAEAVRSFLDALHVGPRCGTRH